MLLDSFLSSPLTFLLFVGIGPALFSPVLALPVAQTNSSIFARDGDQGGSCNIPKSSRRNIQVPQFASYDETKAMIYRYRQQYGVNLGSLFVHEKWMVPSFYACTPDAEAEAELASQLLQKHGSKAGQAFLEHNWDTFITEDDFRYLSSIGINTVRLPIGYWNLGPEYTKGTDFDKTGGMYKNSWSRVLRVISWAEKYEIGVLVDLHGAPGSQNGQQHSGVTHEAQLWSDQSNMDKTIEVLKFLAQNVGNISNVVGLQILNEPQNQDQLKPFYTKAIQELREASASLPLYFHDAFSLQELANFLAKEQGFYVLDHHSYFVYTDADKKESPADHTKDIATGSVASQLKKASKTVHGNMIVGEWSAALTSGDTEAQKQFVKAQVDSYGEHGAGWEFWSYKTDDCDSNPSWCLREAVSQKIMETPLGGLSSRRQSYDFSAGGVAPEKFMSNGNPQVKRKVGGGDGKGPLRPTSSGGSSGRSDGKKVAMTFEQHNSRLGFVQQYIRQYYPKYANDDGYEKDFRAGLQS